MSSSILSPYLLLELPDISDSINYPIRNVQRIKYTCFDVSKTWIAFGATSGGVYVFNRSPCEFVQLIPNKDGTITRLAISTDEKHISYANGKGVVTVSACDQTLSGQSSITSKEHQGNEVTAMVWSRNMLFTGDDVGRVSVLQLPNFITKTMFQNTSQTIMSLDSRICQLDVKGSMLLVSTLTRCYICDTAQEQYRQIGQKLRDGEFGACFANKENAVENGTAQIDPQHFTEVKKYNIVDDGTGFAVSKELANTLIYCARPSSRLWEATVDGTVRRTHQFKQVLSKPTNVITFESYTNENVSMENDANIDGQSVNFLKIYSMNSTIFSFRKDALFFLNIEDVDNTVWYDSYKDIVDCKIYHDLLYIWTTRGSLISLRFMKIDKLLVKCYIDEKYVLCAELCAFFSDYLLSNTLSNTLHIVAGLREKIDNKESLSKIENVLVKFESLKSNEATQMKSGIYVVDNTYQTQSLLDDSNRPKQNDDNTFTTLPPEALQTLKDLSVTVTDKLSTSKKILKEKWEDFEGKMKVKHLSSEKQQVQEVSLPKRVPQVQPSSEYVPVELDNDIIYKESSQKAIDIDNNSLEQDKICKALYQYYRLSLVDKEMDESNLISTIENYACDINQIYDLMLLLEQYCISVGDFEESKFAPYNIFLSYLNASTKKEELLDCIINDETLYKYFVDSCISVNMKTQKLSNIGCECGYPLPFTRTNKTPVFSDLIDEFIERQWSSQSRNQCYEICKKMPYLWRKILYLRRNEDLLNVLRILLQMLDENLLHSFLPQFTLDTWDRAIQLYATLHANMCLNCNKKFNHVSVKDMLSWDDMGALIIKSVGGKNAIKVLEKRSNLIEPGALTVRFYHTSLLATMFEKCDVTITSQLIDALYCCYDNEDSKTEICKLLHNSKDGQIRNTALPLSVAAKSTHWGLSVAERGLTLQEVLAELSNINIIDCSLCGLPLNNDVLIRDGGIWVFKCGHIFHGACLELNKVKLCPACSVKVQ